MTENKTYCRWRHLTSTSLDDQLTLKLHLAQLITTYLDVILWFLNAGLLPEQSEVKPDEMFHNVYFFLVFSQIQFFM